MPKYCLQESYQAAVLETDWTRMEERIQAAEAEIHKRGLILSQDHDGTLEEREALVKAISCLSFLRKDVVVWFENQKLQPDFSAAINLRSRCGSVRFCPVPSSHRTPGAAPQVGQRMASICLGVTSLSSVSVPQHRVRQFLWTRATASWSSAIL
jgi:hypothetical protein